MVLKFGRGTGSEITDDSTEARKNNCESRLVTVEANITPRTGCALKLSVKY